MLGALFTAQEKLIFFPETLPADYRYQFSRPVEEVFLNAEDGAKINALHFTDLASRGVTLYFHGNAGSLRSWGSLSEEILPLSFDLFIPDYRGFGKSTGKMSEKALHADAKLAYDYLRKQYPAEKIIVYGRSIGTGIAVKLASEQPAAALVLETPYTNLVDLAKAHYPMLPASLLLSYTLRSDEWINQVKCPVLIMHGTADQVVPYALGKKLAEKAGSAASFVSIPGGSHNNLSAYPEYFAALTSFLNKALPEAR
jgi:pimeloyl-ACP methyl ester carboxylesterase